MSETQLPPPRVVLCVAPVHAIEQQRAYVGDIPSIGTAYLASSLEAAGFPTEVFNAGVVAVTPAELAARIVAVEPALVGFTLYDDNFGATFQTIHALREHYTGPVVLGGYTATFTAERLLSLWSKVDFVIVGEGEGPLVRLMQQLQAGGPLDEVPSLAFRRDGDVVLTPRAPPAVLDDLPWPQRRWPKTGDATPLLTGRGCGSSCSICAMVPFYDRTAGPAVRRREPVDVVDEMAHCFERGSELFFMYDDCFPLASRADRAWCARFLAELERRDLRVPFMVQTRVIDVLRGRDLIPELEAAGLCHLSLGVESLVPRQLELYGKLHTVPQSLEAMEILAQRPLRTHFNVLFWDPHLSLAEAREHARLIVEHGLDNQEASVGNPSHRSVLTPFAGTGVHRWMMDQGLAQRDLFAFHQVHWDFVDPGLRSFFHGAYQRFLQRVEVPRPQALWLISLMHELRGRPSLSQRISQLASTAAGHEFAYFQAVLEQGALDDGLEALDRTLGADFREAAGAVQAAVAIQ